jgi:hypothetical protein
MIRMLILGLIANSPAHKSDRALASRSLMPEAIEPPGALEIGTKKSGWRKRTRKGEDMWNNNSGVPSLGVILADSIG